MEPKPNYIPPEWDTLEELDLNPEQAPEPKPKSRFFYKFALTVLVLVFLAGIVLPNLGWLNNNASEHNPKKHLWSVTKITKDPESKVIYSPAEDSFIILNATKDNLDLHKLSNGAYLYSLSSSPTSIQDITYSPDGLSFALALDTGDISIHASLTGAESKTLPHTVKPMHIAWSPNAHHLAAVYENGHLCLWDLTTDSYTKVSEQASGLPTWSPNGRYLNLFPENPVGSPEHMRLFDMQTLSELSYPVDIIANSQPAHFMKHSDKILYGVAFAEQIIEWDLKNNRSYAFDPNEGWLGTSSISPNEQRLFTTLTGIGDFHILDLETKKRITTFSYNEEPNLGYNLSWSPDSKHIVVAYETGIDFHNAETGAFEYRITLDPRFTNLYHGFSPDGQMLLTTDGYSFSLWSPQTGTLLYKVVGPYFANKVFWFQNSSQLIMERQDAVDIYRISEKPGGPAFDISANPSGTQPIL